MINKFTLSIITVDSCPIRVEYALTKKENALNSVLGHVAEFFLQYESEKILKDEKPRNMIKYFGTDILSEVYD
jgi:DNA-binding HxlR family transcriptional regulator